MLFRSYTQDMNGMNRTILAVVSIIALLYSGLCFFLTLTNSFKMFDLNTSLTQGGPAGMYMLKAVKTSEMLALNIYNTAITKNLWGQGQAKAIMFFIMLVVISLLQVSINKKREVEM